MALYITRDDLENLHECLHVAAAHYEDNAEICQHGTGVPAHAREALVKHFKTQAQQARMLALKLTEPRTNKE